MSPSPCSSQLLSRRLQPRLPGLAGHHRGQALPSVKAFRGCERHSLSTYFLQFVSSWNWSNCHLRPERNAKYHYIFKAGMPSFLCNVYSLCNSSCRCIYFILMQSLGFAQARPLSRWKVYDTPATVQVNMFPFHEKPKLCCSLKMHSKLGVETENTGALRQTCASNMFIFCQKKKSTPPQCW